MIHLTVVSDSHLSPRTPEADDSWDAVLAHVRRRQPRMVVHAGDLSLNGAVADGELEHARARLDELTVPWRAIPGNHDIGDVPGDPEPVDDRRRARYTEVFGEATWVEHVGRWRLVGIDVQTACSSLGAAAGVWEVLGEAMDPDRPTVVFLHRPVQPLATGEADATNRFVPAELRPRLRDVLDRGDVRAVVSGHVHQWRTGTADERLQVWAPSCWALLPERIQATVGRKVCGVIDLDLGDDGGVEARLVRPDGMAQLTIGDDFPSPFPDPH